MNNSTFYILSRAIALLEFKHNPKGLISQKMGVVIKKKEHQVDAEINLRDSVFFCKQIRCKVFNHIFPLKPLSCNEAMHNKILK